MRVYNLPITALIWSMYPTIFFSPPIRKFQFTLSQPSSLANNPFNRNMLYNRPNTSELATFVNDEIEWPLRTSKCFSKRLPRSSSMWWLAKKTGTESNGSKFNCHRDRREENRVRRSPSTSSLPLQWVPGCQQRPWLTNPVQKMRSLFTPRSAIHESDSDCGHWCPRRRRRRWCWSWRWRRRRRCCQSHVEVLNTKQGASETEWPHDAASTGRGFGRPHPWYLL